VIAGEDAVKPEFTDISDQARAKEGYESDVEYFRSLAKLFAASVGVRDVDDVSQVGFCF